MRHLRALSDDGRADHDLRKKAWQALDDLAGQGIPEDPAETDAHWAETNERGNEKSIYRLACGWAGNRDEAVDLYEKVARLGHAVAQYKLGM